MTTSALASSFQKRSASPTLRPEFVHEGLRLEQHDPRPADQPLGRQSLMSRAKRADPVRRGDRLDRHEADVVSVVRVARARIAESRDHQHGAPDR